jgi:hypothetical protein
LFFQETAFGRGTLQKKSLANAEVLSYVMTDVLVSEVLSYVVTDVLVSK